SRPGLNMPKNSLSPVETVHRLLFRALLEMRSQGHDQKDKLVFHLADLFHTVVLEMKNAAEGKCTYEEVLRLLANRAKEMGLDRWFKSNVDALVGEPLPQE